MVKLLKRVPRVPRLPERKAKLDTHSGFDPREARANNRRWCPPSFFQSRHVGQTIAMVRRRPRERDEGQPC
jgi:hypothetical protein